MRVVAGDSLPRPDCRELANLDDNEGDIVREGGVSPFSRAIEDRLLAFPTI